MYITCMGGIYRLSATKYRKMLLAIIAGQDDPVENYAKMIGIVETDVTDLTLEEAEDLLNQIS